MIQAERQKDLKKLIQGFLKTDKKAAAISTLCQSAKMFVRLGQQQRYVRVMAGQLLKGIATGSPNLSYVIQLLDRLMKEQKNLRLHISKVIAQLYVELFSIFSQNHNFSEIEEMKKMRKKWVLMLPEETLKDIKKRVHKKFKYDLDDFSQKVLNQLREYYKKELKMPNELIAKHLPKINKNKTEPPSLAREESSQEPRTTKLPKPVQNMTPMQQMPQQPMMPPYQMPGYDAYPPPQYMHPMYDPNAYAYPRYPPYGPGPMMQNNMPNPMGYMNYNHYYPNMYPQQGIPQPLNNINVNNMGQGMANMSANVQSKQSMAGPVVSQPVEPYYVNQPFQPTHQPEEPIKPPPTNRNGTTDAISRQLKQLRGFNLKCPICGLQSSQRHNFDMHQKSHVQQSRRAYQASKKCSPMVRQHLPTTDEWLSQQQQQEQVEVYVEIASTTETSCKLCSNPFRPNWDVKIEKWVYRNAVLVTVEGGKTLLHYDCFKALDSQR